MYTLVCEVSFYQLCCGYFSTQSFMLAWRYIYTCRDDIHLYNAIITHYPNDGLYLDLCALCDLMAQDLIAQFEVFLWTQGHVLSCMVAEGLNVSPHNR